MSRLKARINRWRCEKQGHQWRAGFRLEPTPRRRQPWQFEMCDRCRAYQMVRAEGPDYVAPKLAKLRR